MLTSVNRSGSDSRPDGPPQAGAMAVLQLEREPEKSMTPGQELALVRAAHARAPTANNRRRLVRMLMFEDLQDGVRTLLEGAADRSLLDEMALANAWLALEDGEGDRRALSAAERALALADRDTDRAAALALRGKALTRLGDRSGARLALGAALALDPGSKDACKRIAALDLADGRFDDVLALTERLGAEGVAHARLFGARMLAHAGRGDIAAARGEAGEPQHHHAVDLAPPPGWDSIGAFNSVLSSELLAHPGARLDRYGSASNFTLRVEAPARADTPAVRALVGQIIATIERQVAGMDRAGDPWAAAMPSRAFLRTWCVITDSDGYEGWHVHQFGWMSGVYYVRVPDQIARGNSRNGCLAFGLPDDLTSAAAADAYGERIVRPREGLLLTFPSQAYHRTFPHETGQKRICFAFDVRPIE